MGPGGHSPCRAGSSPVAHSAPTRPPLVERPRTGLYGRAAQDAPLVIPRTRPPRVAQTTRVTIPRPFAVAQHAPEGPARRPPDANEFLHFYDDQDFDAGLVDAALASRLVPGFNLSCNAQLQTEWAPCTILTRERGMSAIAFSDGGITKAVHRISMCIASENEARFSRRRAIAEGARRRLQIRGAASERRRAAERVGKHRPGGGDAEPPRRSAKGVAADPGAARGRRGVVRDIGGCLQGQPVVLEDTLFRRMRERLSQRR